MAAAFCLRLSFLIATIVGGVFNFQSSETTAFVAVERSHNSHHSLSLAKQNQAIDSVKSPEETTTTQTTTSATNATTTATATATATTPTPTPTTAAAATHTEEQLLLLEPKPNGPSFFEALFGIAVNGSPWEYMLQMKRQGYDEIVPVDLKFAGDYNFLLMSGIG